MYTLVYNSAFKNSVTLSFDMDGLRVIHHEKVIAIFGIESVWDAAKMWLAGIKIEEVDVGLRRRKLEALIAKASSLSIAKIITYTH